MIRGWAPQAIGAFLTHCSWNSTLEGVSAGVPMITWPQFEEQFFNEKLVVQVSETGVSIGTKGVVHWGEEQKIEVKVNSCELKKAIEKGMDGGERRLIKKKKCKRAWEDGK